MPNKFVTTMVTMNPVNAGIQPTARAHPVSFLVPHQSEFCSMIRAEEIIGGEKIIIFGAASISTY